MKNLDIDTPFNGKTRARYKRVYKRVNGISEAALEPQIETAVAEGWTRGKTHVNIDNIHPYEHHLYKDLEKWPHERGNKNK